MDRSIISNVIQGRASAAEQEWVNTWLAENQRHQNEFEDLCILLEPAPDALPGWEGGTRLTKSIRHSTAMRQRRQRLLRMALLVLTISIIGIFYQTQKKGTPIQLRNATLAEVAQVLKQQYNITLLFPPSLQAQRWSGAFWQPTPEEAVAMIAVSLHTTYQRSGKSFTLNPQR